jgi:hypothetical protein
MGSSTPSAAAKAAAAASYSPTTPSIAVWDGWSLYWPY